MYYCLHFLYVLLAESDCCLIAYISQSVLHSKNVSTASMMWDLCVCVL